MASQAFVQGGPVGYVKAGLDQTGVRDSKKAVARPIPLNYQVRHNFFSFFLPHFPGAPASEGCCSQSERLAQLLSSRADNGVLFRNQIREELPTRTKPLARRTLRVR